MPRASPSAFEILLVTGQDEMSPRRDLYRGAEGAWHHGPVNRSTTRSTRQRTTDYDFDMTHYIRSLSLSPGNEQLLYWGSAGATEPGTRNWMGINSPASRR
jgi:peptide/nickel transport system substrate-binding protein